MTRGHARRSANAALRRKKKHAYASSWTLSTARALEGVHALVPWRGSTGAAVDEGATVDARGWCGWPWGGPPTRHLDADGAPLGHSCTEPRAFPPRFGFEPPKSTPAVYSGATFSPPFGHGTPPERPCVDPDSHAGSNRAAVPPKAGPQVGVQCNDH